MTVTLGPLALPASLLITFATIFLGAAVGNRMAAKAGVRAEGSLWLVIAGAVLAARIAFVARYWSQYAAEPWRLPDLRDGGMEPIAGVAAAVLIGALLAWRRQQQRKAIVGALGAALLVWGVGTGLANMMDESGARQGLPQLTLAGLDGRPVRLAAFAGKPVVINLWASWCPPCRREMPALGKAQKESPGVHVVFVNQGEDAATVQAYLTAEGLPLKNVVLDPGGQLASTAGVPGLPTTLFFDAGGSLVDKRMGELSPATLAAHLDALHHSTARTGRHEYIDEYTGNTRETQ